MAGGRLGGVGLCFLIVGVGLVGACRDQDPSYFAIRPVTRELPPPCGHAALREEEQGRAVRCFEVGRTWVNAKDVATARVVVDPGTNAEVVVFTLTAKGAERFNALARAVGRGGQAAIVVDGIVASAPRFDTTEFPGTGRVTGLEHDAAQRLVRRLNHG